MKPPGGFDIPQFSNPGVHRLRGRYCLSVGVLRSRASCDRIIDFISPRLTMAPLILGAWYDEILRVIDELALDAGDGGDEFLESNVDYLLSLGENGDRK